MMTTLEVCQIAGRAPTIVLDQAPIRSRVVEEAQAEIRRIGGSLAEQATEEVRKHDSLIST
jgi:hypothetical protein